MKLKKKTMEIEECTIEKLFENSNVRLYKSTDFYGWNEYYFIPANERKKF